MLRGEKYISHVWRVMSTVVLVAGGISVLLLCAPFLKETVIIRCACYMVLVAPFLTYQGHQMDIIVLPQTYP